MTKPNRFRPGDVVVAPFAGATKTKRRPAVVVSTELYHEHHPDVVLGLLTSQLRSARTPTDCVLRDWAEAGLHQPSAFRAYFGIQLAADVDSIIGLLSTRDWQAVQSCLQLAIAFADSLPHKDDGHSESPTESEAQ